MPTSERDPKGTTERTDAGPTRESDVSEPIRDCDPEATIDRPDRRGYEEVYVVPEPESERYRVFVLTANGHLHHVGGFDLATLDREASAFPAAALSVLASE